MPANKVNNLMYFKIFSGYSNLLGDLCANINAVICENLRKSVGDFITVEYESFYSLILC